MDVIIQYIKENPSFVVANIIAFAAVAITFVSYQVSSQKKLLVIQSIATVVSAVSFMVLGAWTGLAMNCVAIFRNIAYYNKDKKYLSSKWVPLIFAAIMLVFGIFTWTKWYCILSVAGLMINTVALSFPSAQLIRGSILVTSPMVCLYDLLAGNIIEAVKELIAIVSAVIGIFRYRKNKKA